MNPVGNVGFFFHFVVVVYNNKKVQSYQIKSHLGGKNLALITGLISRKSCYFHHSEWGYIGILLYDPVIWQGGYQCVAQPTKTVKMKASQLISIAVWAIRYEEKQKSTHQWAPISSIYLQPIDVSSLQVWRAGSKVSKTTAELQSWSSF